MIVEIMQWTGRDEVFAAALAGGKQKRDVGDLFGKDVDSAVNPNDLLVGVGKTRAGIGVLAREPSGGIEGTAGRVGGRGSRVEAGDGDIEAEEIHAC
jgi:hypothetical protein